MRKNDKGQVVEIWTHATCGEMFEMTRDTRTMKVLGVTCLRREKS